MFFASMHCYAEGLPVDTDQSEVGDALPGIPSHDTTMGQSGRNNVLSFPSPPVPARRRGKCMSRRNGQNPKARVGKRADGTKYFFFQYWIDVPGQEERKRLTEVIGTTGQMTKSEAERQKLDFIQKLEINSDDY